MADAILKKCKVCQCEKVLAEFSKKERGILGVRPECNVCRSNMRRERYKSDDAYRTKVLATQKERNALSPERNRAKARAWARNNPERYRESQRQRRRARPDHLNQEYQRRYRERNPHIGVAACARRAAAKITATPAWATGFFIKEAYHIARVRSKVTGVKWHVDHIVPLRSPFVCGLHVEHNFQLLPAKANKLKSNLWWPDMWEPL